MAPLAHPAAVGESGATAPRAERALSDGAGPPGLLSVRSSAAAWGAGVSPSTPRARCCEAASKGALLMSSTRNSQPGEAGPCMGCELSRGSRWRILGRGKHLAARAAAAAASGEAVGSGGDPVPT